MVPWAPPSYATPPSNFAALPVGPLTRAQIQAQLDTGNGVCLLPAGRYQLDGPLLLGSRADGTRRILVGAGKAQTVLYAADSNTDLIQEKNDGPGASSIDLIGVTLSGGRWGVNLFSVQLNGQWVQRQYLDCYLADVCIRDMSAGGWHIENIYGMDNNAYQGLDFVNCPIGWQQIGGGDASTYNWAYMDKNTWSNCQWIDCGVAMDLHPSRASGGNAFLECRFQGCRTAIIPPPANHSPLSWINCDFIDNAGDPMIYDYGECYFVSCRIQDSGQARSLYDGYHSIFEGCTFTKSASSTCKIISSARETTISSLHIGLQNDYNGRCTHFLNSYVGMPVGQWYNGSAINSTLTDPADTYRAGAIVYADADKPDYSGAPIPANRLHYTVLDASTPTPRPGVLLAGHIFQLPLGNLPTGVPSITSATAATFTLGTPASFTVTATTSSGGVLAYGADLLPPGLAIDATTGVIGGTPTRIGSWLCPIRVSNPAGVATAWLKLTVIGQPPGAPSFGALATTQSGAAGAPFALSAAASGATSYTADGLPPGLTIDPATGLISGCVNTLGAVTTIVTARGPDGAAAIEILFAFTITTPTPSVWTDTGTGKSYAAITFRRLTGAGGNATVETSTDLVAWSSATADVIPQGAPIPADDDLSETVLYRSTHDVATDPRRFFRVRTTAP